MALLRRSSTGCAFVVILATLSPTAQAQGLLERLEKRLEGVLAPGERAAPLAESAPAAAEPGYLGMVADDTGEEGRGLRVLSVREGGPAQGAGLREGDLVVAVDGAPITNLDELDRQLAGSTAGMKITIKVEREGKTHSLPVTLGRRPDPVVAAPSEPEIAPDVLPAPRTTEEPPLRSESRLVTPSRASLGVTVATVTEDARRRYGLSVRQGALVTAITPGSSADRSGLPLGAVIVAADGRRIEQPDELIDLVRGMRPGDELMLSYYRGSTLLRKTVRLGEAGRAETAAAEIDEPRRDTVREGDRPLLRRLERALDAVGPERPLPERASVPAAASSRESVDELRAEVDRLRARVEELELRLTKIESGAGRRAPEEPVAEDRPVEDRIEPDPAAEPPLRLNPPKEPPPRPTPEPR